MKKLYLSLAVALSLAPLACTPPPSHPASRQEPSPRQGRTSAAAHASRSDDLRPGHSENRRDRERTASGAPGSFDFYLLNLSWSPEFCATHPAKPECATHPGFVLHGLWPQNNDGSYPQHCTEDPGPGDAAEFRDLYPDPGLLQHEWQTHGTCSGLDPRRFFENARHAMAEVHIPQQLTGLDHQASMPPESILGLFTAANPSLPRESLALSCGNNYLSAIEVCLGKDLHPITCQQVRSCRANSVRIPPRMTR